MQTTSPQSITHLRLLKRPAKMPQKNRKRKISRFFWQQKICLAKHSDCQKEWTAIHASRKPNDFRQSNLNELNNYLSWACCQALLSMNPAHGYRQVLTAVRAASPPLTLSSQFGLPSSPDSEMRTHEKGEESAVARDARKPNTAPGKFRIKHCDSRNLKNRTAKPIKKLGQDFFSWIIL